MPKGLEIERRWLVSNYREDILMRPGREIVQGYLAGSSDESRRVRIVDEKEAFLTIKRGFGKVREEMEEPIPLDKARELLATTNVVLKKRRIKLDGWDIDVLKQPPFGFFNFLPIIIAERELESEDEVIELPDWISNSLEVTDLLTSELLARFAESLARAPDDVEDDDAEDDGAERALSNFGGRKIVLLVGGSDHERKKLASMVMVQKPSVMIDAYKAASWLFPSDPTRLQAFLIKSARDSKRPKQEALFVLTGDTLEGCWKGRSFSPFASERDDMLTVLLDIDRAVSLEFYHWQRSREYPFKHALQGGDLFAHWANAYDVHVLGQTATPEMQVWAVKNILDSFFALS